MRADRLLYILQCLQAQPIVSARELAAQLEVSGRTVHRDMEALAQAGFPVYAERGAHGGWRLPEGYRTRLTGLTAAEIAGLAVLRSSSAVRDLNLSAAADSALAKLASALSGPARDEAAFVRKHLHIDGAGWHDAREPAPHLGLVQRAVWERRKLRIRYSSGSGGDGPEIVVQPWGLVAKRHTWYFAAVREEREPAEKPAAGKTDASVARDEATGRAGSGAVTQDAAAEKADSGAMRDETTGQTRPDAAQNAAAHEAAEAIVGSTPPSAYAKPELPEPRTYRVSRLAAVELLEERFEVPDAFDLAQWWERSVAQFRRDLPVYPVRLRVREQVWARFSREIYVRIKTSFQTVDGWQEAEADFHTPESALAILLGYGASVRVLSPLTLARSVLSEANALRALYEGPDSAPQDQGHI